MADSEFDCFTRAELMDLLKFNESELNKEMVKAEPSEENEIKAAGEMKALLETKITNIKAALKATMVVSVPLSSVAETTPAAAQNYDQQMVKTMKETATVQNLLDVIRAVPKLSVGDSIERFVSELDQIFKVEVQPQLGEISSLENEFVRAAKRLLTFSMYEQMDKSSGTDTDSWNGMKKYLIENHGSKITMFQHLNRLWRLELKPDEKLTDFGARLEEAAYKALLHIRKSFGKEHKNADDTAKAMTDEDVFKLFTAMLASLQVRKEHEEIFKQMIKHMDKHWSASSLLADAQDYVDRLGSNQNATKTGVEVAFHSNANRNKSSHQKKPSQKSSDESTKILKDIQKKIEANEKAIQSLTFKKSAQTGERSGDFSSISKEEIKKIIKAGKQLPKDQQICISFLKGNCKGKCKDGRKHQKDYKVYMVLQEDVVGDIQAEADLDALFQ